MVAADLGGVSDNPLFFPDDDLVVHGGNFFGQPAAFAADVLTMVIAQVGNLAERQLDLLVDPDRNGGLPPMLAAGPGQQHGLQGVQLASTALIAEIRRDAMPASMQSLPTNLHNQDVDPARHPGRPARPGPGRAAAPDRRVARAGAAPGRARGRAGRRPRRAAPRCWPRWSRPIPPIDPDRPLDGDVRAPPTSWKA